METASGIRQNMSDASVSDVELKRENTPRIVFEMGTKFESIKTCVSALEVSLIYTTTVTATASKKSAAATRVLRGFKSTKDERPNRMYCPNCTLEGTSSSGQ